MIKTVLFDMDGVIVDTEPVHRFAYFEHFKELGIDVTEEMFTTYTGNSTRNVFQRIKEHFGLDHEVESLIQRKRSIFNDAFDYKEDLTLLEGVEDLIKDLHSNGIQMILASSASKVTIDRVFRRFNLHQYFSHIVSGEDFPKSKPDPAIFLHAAKLSGDSRDQCIVIEDSTNGVKAANAANIFCIGYRSFHSKLQNLETADMIISKFSEIDAAKVRSITGKIIA